jgi:RNA polymerase sigma-70 factor (ECF subfamily)
VVDGDAERLGRARADYGHLVEPCLERAMGYARALLGNRPDAEDAVQQAVLRGMERFASFDPARPFAGWWFAVLRNCCLDLLRARGRHRPLALLEPAAAEPAAAPMDQERPESWEALAQAMDRLAPDHAAILRLRYFGELSYDELSQALDIPRGTVMSRLHYARARLAALMTKVSP